MLDHDKAMKLWKETFGEKTEAYDYFGRNIYKAAYGQRGSKVGWDIHHKRPKNKGGTDKFENLQIVHVKTHDKLNGL
jgi:hypothetical protein